MKRNEFMCQAALNIIAALGVVKHNDVEQRARYITETMEEHTPGIFDDAPQDKESSNTVELKPYEAIKIVPAMHIKCNMCVDFESCQGRRANPLLGAPCPELKVAVITKEL